MFVNSPAMITENSCLKCRSNDNILRFFKYCVVAHYSHVSYACYQNMPQNLSSCHFATNNFAERLYTY